MIKTLSCLCIAFTVLAGCPFQKDAGASKEDCPFAKKAAQIEQPPAVTAMGCTCKSDCGASIGDLYNCDWCYTEDSCGQHGLSGYYDYCVYPLNKTYEYQDWQTKLDYLWEQIDADHTSAKIPSLLGILKESIQTTFDNHADIMPAGRKKFIHGVGAVCKFNLQVAPSSPFTGVFKASNVAHGLVRMGSALPVDLKSGVVPGLGIKFLRSKVPSGNFVALHTLSPLPNNSYNFFGETLTNHIPPATGAAAILGKKFNQASNCITQVGLSDICRYDNDGAPTTKIEFPFQLNLDSKVIQFPTTPIMQSELQEMLAAIPSGTSLFEVSYYTDPKHAHSGVPATVLGTMVTDGPCVNSAFGDESLFFKHQLIEEDWELQPTWPGYLEPSDCSASTIDPHPPKQCQTDAFAQAVTNQ